jgi:uncharacterized membrane protein YoaK (UPF0700 family)
MRAEEAIEIALLLAFSGGYFDAYTWVIHGVMANTQTANLVLLWYTGRPETGAGPCTSYRR